MHQALLIGGAAPYREAVGARFATVGVTVVDHDAAQAAPAQTVVVAYCTGVAEWETLEGLDGFLGRTAVIDRIDRSLYLRAMKAGVGVVHIDTRSETIVEVALAAGRGEIVLPFAIARQVAEAVTTMPDGDPIELDPLETDIIRSIARGESLVSIADRYFYSERTLRRRLQSACIKLGAQDRAGAIRAAERLGLL